MKKLLTFILFWSMLLTATAQPQTDPRSIQVAGIPIEGPLDSVRVSLKAGDFTEWGQSDDGEDYYFRGNFYGIRAKLMLSIATETKLVTSAIVPPICLRKIFNTFFIRCRRTMVTSPNAITPGTI